MIASLIFLGTLALIITQPKQLSVGTTAVLGAVTAYLFGVVDTQDILTVTHIVWDATLAFIGIIILSMVLDEIGFFEWAALKMVRLSRGNGYWMFINVLLLGALVAAFFANDGAALILTPIILAKIKHLRLSPTAMFAFVMAGGFIGDSASNPLVISNLTNIVTADYFHIGFWQYARHMFIPNLISIIASLAVLWLFFRPSIPARIDIDALPHAASAIKHPLMFKLSWWFLGLLSVGYFIGDRYHLPVSIFALGGALVFLALAAHYKATKPLMTLKAAPWHVVWFSIGLYVVVYGLKNAGLTLHIAQLIDTFRHCGDTQAIVGTGFLAAVLSSIMNNMPTIMLMDIAIDHIGHIGNEALIYANILGCNLGPKMTPIGSLATLLWLHVLAQKGVQIGWRNYMKIGLIITPPVLLTALLSITLGF